MARENSFFWKIKLETEYEPIFSRRKREVRIGIYTMNLGFLFPQEEVAGAVHNKQNFLRMVCEDVFDEHSLRMAVEWKDIKDCVAGMGEFCSEKVKQILMKKREYMRISNIFHKSCSQ